MADLAPEKRQQLDGIVQKMDSSGASTEDIQAVVDDFKKKYSITLSGKPHMQGMQPQAGEDPNLNSDWTDTAMKSLATTGTVGAAAAMLPEGAAEAAGKYGATALRSLLAGGAGAGVDVAMGGDHPVRTGVETGLAAAVLDVPGASKIIRAVLPYKLRALFDMLPTGEKAKLAEEWVPVRGKTSPSIGSIEPEYSPASPKSPGTKILDRLTTPQEPWSPVRGSGAPGYPGPSEPTYSPSAPKPPGTVLLDKLTTPEPWKPVRGPGSKYPGSSEPDYSPASQARPTNQNYSIKELEKSAKAAKVKTDKPVASMTPAEKKKLAADVGKKLKDLLDKGD